MERTNREIQEVRTQRRITGHHRFDDKNASATDISSKAFKQLAPLLLYRDSATIV